MENWGAIAYNESALLWKDGLGTTSQRRVYNIIAHEIAHQWFGNLVTMAWWDNLWLNEGFASWMASRTTHKFNPQWESLLSGVSGRERAMADDARRTTHAIQTPVQNEAQALSAFDAITYNKGEAFLRMLENWLGEDAFRRGMRSYMAEHQFSNTTTADLWHHLSAAAGRDVAQMAGGWTQQPGFPLIRVSQVCNGNRSTVTLKQERFTLNDPRARTLYWQVPVAVIAAGVARQNLLVPRDGTPVSATLATCASAVADPSDSGYYRVAYDAALGAAHAARFSELSAAEQMKLLNDTFSLAKQGSVEFATYFALLAKFTDTTHSALWSQAVEQQRTLHRLLRGREGYAAFARRTQALVAPVLARLGLELRPGETPLQEQLRERAITLLAETGHEPTIRDAKLLFARWQTEPSLLSGNLRGAVLQAAGAGFNGADIAWAWQAMQNATGVQERWQLQAAARSMRDPALMALYLDMLLATDKLTSTDVTFNLSHAADASGHVELVWSFMQKNRVAIAAKAGRYGSNGIAPAIARNFTTEARADELENYVRGLATAAGDFDATGPARDAAEWVRLQASVAPRLFAALR
jgi:aminopeptidase N